MKVTNLKYYLWLCLALCLSHDYLTAQSRMQDSLALVELYDATDGANWNSPWDLNTPIDQWTGVTYNNGVTGISLQNGGLSGTLPNLNLPNLIFLILKQNQLTGTLPDFSNCPALVNLRLGSNQFEGNIPNFNLPDLMWLTLSSNELEGSIPDFNFPKLLTLELNRNNLNGEIPSFSKLTSIVTLDLSSNELTGTIPDFNQFSLSYLLLNSNQLTGDIPSLLMLFSIRELSLYSNQLGGTIPDYAHFTQLEKLLIGNRNLVGTIPNFALPMLQELYLSGSRNITGPIPNFNFVPNLTTLWLSSCPKLTELPTFTLPNLQYLYVNSSAFSFDDLIPNIGKASTFYNTGNQHLYCNPDPVVLNKNVGEQLTIDLAVDASITDNVYQWYKVDGFSSIAYGTPSNQNTLVFNNLTATDVGTYFCRITNPAISGSTITSCDYTIMLPCNVSASDSMALIDLYTDLDGPNWTITWDLNMPISTWHGVDLDVQCKITDIRLVDNNLKGVLPNVNLPDVTFFLIGDDDVNGALPDFSNAPNLLLFQGINCNLTDVPDLSSHPTLVKVLIANNKLTFEDIIPNEAKMHQNPPFQGYSIQQTLPAPADDTLQIGDAHTITIPSFDQGITSNVYEWFLGNTSLGAGNGQSFTLTNVSLADAGNYTLKVTNPNAPDLTLYSDTISITVIGGTGSCDQADLTIATINQSAYHAQQTITSTATVSTSTTFKAGTSIILQAGFEVTNGTTFAATIESCSAVNSEETPATTFLATTNASVDRTTLTNTLEAYPNPFNSQTTLDYLLTQTGVVQIVLYDISGKQLQVLENSVKEKGKYQTTLNGEYLESGIYFLQAILGESIQMKKVYLVK